MRAKWMMLAAAGAALATGTAAADPKHGKRYAYARVVGVEPIVHRVTVERPRRECWEEIVYESEPEPFGKAGVTLAGAILGGAVGRQFGSGSGRDAMTLIGSVAGAAVANERAERRAEAYSRGRTRAVPVERCEVVHARVTEERVEGYRVTYRYGGRHYTTRMHERPADRIRVLVSVAPAYRPHPVHAVHPGRGRGPGF